MQIPPAVIDLDLRLDCPLSGTPVSRVAKGNRGVSVRAFSLTALTKGSTVTVRCVKGCCKFAK